MGQKGRGRISGRTWIYTQNRGISRQKQDHGEEALWGRRGGEWEVNSGLLLLFFIICMYVCSTLRLNYGKPEDLDNLWASHRGFPTSSRNFRARRCYLGARGTGSLAETAEGLISSPLPPVALCPGFCVWEGVTSSPLTWERFALDLVSPAAMT